MGSKSSKPEPKVSTEKKERARWRRTSRMQWTEEGLTDLRNRIKEAAESRDEELKLLVFGPTGSGKSSFCNGLKTAITGARSVQRYFGVGSAHGSFTKGFLGWKWENIVIVDMAGVCEQGDIKDVDVKKIFLGQVPIKSKLSDTLEASNVPHLEEKKNAYNCVVLVLKPGQEFSHETKRILSMAGKLVGEGDVAYHLVLTHLDLIDSKYHNPENLTDILDSDLVQEHVLEMSQQMGVPLNSTSFVRNYSGETDSHLHCDALLLDTMKQIVETAIEQAEKRDMKDIL